MKKIGKKLSFLTKIMLVFGLLVSNLSSLSVVFAYEAPADVVISLSDDELNVSYTQELAEEVEAVKVKVYETYTYLDGESITPVVSDFLLNEEQLLAASEGGLEFVYETIFSSLTDDDYKLFDGTYTAKVEIIDVTDYTENIEDEAIETVIAYGTYEEEVAHENGLSVKLYDNTDNEVALVGGKYPLNAGNNEVRVVAKILAGGLNPNDVYKYNDEEYFASELVRKPIEVKTLDFNGHLYGEYEELVEVKVLKEVPVINEINSEEIPEVTGEEENVLEEGYEEVVYSNNINIMYGTYPENAEVLNNEVDALDLEDKYLFYNEDKEGLLHVFAGFDEESELATALDLYNVLNAAVDPVGGEQLINYTLVKNGINLLESFAPESEEETIEDYLETIVLDDTVLITLSCKDLTVSYKVVLFGDLNNDNMLTEDDLFELINQYVGENEIENIDKSDIVGKDGEINSLDIIYLNQIIRNKDWNADLAEEEVELEAELNANLGEKEELISGDEFTVDFVLSLTDYDVNGILGKFAYDEELFELLSVEVNEEWAGNSKDGKFAYVGEESLKAPEAVEEEIPEQEDALVAVITEDGEEELIANDYVLITATFRALKATSEDSNNTISLDEIELFNSDNGVATYYVLDVNSVVSDQINVTASADNSLRYLEVAGVKVELVDGVYEYEVTVSNDVTDVDLKYILNNVAASVSSEIYPEELAEGDNTVTITVVAENGDVQEYTITVIREEAEEETTQVSYDYSYDNNHPEREEIVTNEPTEEPEVEEEEDSNLSRIIIIILILIVIAGLVYLIFKDDEDNETKKANKDVNKLKKEEIVPEVKTTKKVEPKKVASTSSKKEVKVTKNTGKTAVKKSSSKTSAASKTNTTKNKTNTKKKER